MVAHQYKDEVNYMYGQEANDMMKESRKQSSKTDYGETLAEIIEKRPKFKYNEDEMLNDVIEYIRTTYQGHYVGKEDIQTTDVWHTLGSAATTTRDTAIKYLMRYGKKGGYNKKDLYKAIHYIVLLNHFTESE